MTRLRHINDARQWAQTSRVNSRHQEQLQLNGGGTRGWSFVLAAPYEYNRQLGRRTMIKYSGLTLVILAATGLALIVSCGDDNPVGPGGGFEYPVYFFAEGMNGTNPMYYRYFPGSERIDSFYLPFVPTYHMSASADGRQLWVSGGDVTYVVDLRTKRVVSELPYNKNSVRFTPDNRYAAVETGDMYILRTDDFSPVFHEPGWIESGRFTTDGKRYYAINRPDSGYMVDLEHDFRVTKKGFGITNLYAGAISRDETKWFLVMGVNYEWSFFLVYDLVADSFIFAHPLCPNPIQLATSPDGRYVYLTAGGSIIFTMCQPSFSFAIYDVGRNEMTSEVQAPVSIPDFLGSFLPLDDFIVTPDGRYLLGKWHEAFSYLLIYDLEKKEVKRLMNLGDKEASSLTTPVSPFEGRRNPCDDSFFGEGWP
jgi:hypothetical protein